VIKASANDLFGKAFHFPIAFRAGHGQMVAAGTGREKSMTLSFALESYTLATRL